MRTKTFSLSLLAIAVCTAGIVAYQAYAENGNGKERSGKTAPLPTLRDNGETRGG